MQSSAFIVDVYKNSCGSDGFYIEPLVASINDIFSSIKRLMLAFPDYTEPSAFVT